MSLFESLWPHTCDKQGDARARGLGWALCPAGAEPQKLHADLWGWQPKLELVRFPHILWKRGGEAQCTTQVVPRGFTCGCVDWESYESLVTVRSGVVLVDSEVLHRGGPTKGASGWVSTCSIELCSASGWEAWLEGTGGTSADPDDPEYAMLPIARIR